MDVPTHQSFTMAVVSPDERSAAGVTRTIGAALSPVFASPLLSSVALLNATFFLASGLKIMYELALSRGFRAIKPPEEKKL